MKRGKVVDQPQQLHTQSAWLVGRDARVADILTAHESCSGQHAVIQFRYVVVPGAESRSGGPVRTVKYVAAITMHRREAHSVACIRVWVDWRAHACIALLTAHSRPYIMDLASTHGTLLNQQRLPANRFVELRPRDILQFGASTRDWVLLHEDLV